MSAEHSKTKSASQKAREEIANRLSKGQTLINHDLTKIFEQYGINGHVATANLASIIGQQLEHHTGQKVLKINYRGRSVYADPLLYNMGLTDMEQTQQRIDESISKKK